MRVWRLICPIVVVLLLILPNMVYGGEKEDVQKDIMILQERAGRLQAEFKLTQIEFQQKAAQLKALEAKEKKEMEAKEKAEQEKKKSEDVKHAK